MKKCVQSSKIYVDINKVEVSISMAATGKAGGADEEYNASEIQVLEGLKVCDVIDHHYSMGSAVVARCDISESLLPGSVPL